MTKPKAWYWKRDGGRGTPWHLYDGRDRSRAVVYPKCVWHTFDEHGVGGANGKEVTHADAMVHATFAVVKQGWTPWELSYRE